ncbi:hypothetical protein C8A00DRAFT_17622 [Chaetomidium leptoderma]|uniref:Uncharacterized protein n=1 Tax=Chaetomidium leptoderma TaxID=669021 RepID=A0AAN6VGX6_9PEZI|nr:hypothetical protein C8A00DRAFT_17622 [Chaetomidium leptoderma]
MAAAPPSPAFQPLKWPRQHQYQAVELQSGDQHPEPEEEKGSPIGGQASQAAKVPPYSSCSAVSPILTPAADTPWPWRPFYLRRRILFSFAVVFALLIVAIETLLAVSNKNNGIATGFASQHYLWTYGPTAFLTLIAATWSRTEYQSKLVAPWIRLLDQPSPAKLTLLLDYLADFQLFAIFKALRNRDFTVSITSTIAILIKVLIVISSGVITLSWNLVHIDSLPMTIQDRFIDSSTRLAHTGTLAYYVMQGLADRNLSYPDGIFNNYAFQSVRNELPDNAEIRVTVDGFENSLECQPAELIFRGSAPPDPHYTNDVMNLTITSPGCNLQDLGMTPTPRWTCGGRDPTCNVLFARFALTQCDGITGDAGKRVLVMFGNLTYSYDYTKTQKDYTGQVEFHPYIAELHQSTQMLCVPTYSITKVDVVRNGTQTRSVTASPGAAHRTLDSVTAWGMMDAHYAAFHNGISSEGSPYGHGVMVSETDVDVDESMGFALPSQLAADQPLASLFDPTFLRRVAAGYYRQFAAIVAKQSLMEPASIRTMGSVTMWQNRLLVRTWAAQWMAGLAATCVLLTAVAAFLVPKRGILPCSPTTLPGMASLVAHSPDLLTMLRFSGAANAESLGRPLLASTFKSGAAVDTLSNEPHFTISSDQHLSLGRAQTFSQVNSKHTHPSVLHPAARLALCFVLAGLIVTVELTLRKSNDDSGLAYAGDGAYIHHTWTTIPAIAFGALAMVFSSIDFQVRSLAPFTALKDTVDAKTFLALDFMDMLVPRTIFHEIKLGNIGALAATTAFLVASLFTILSASLFQPLAISTTIPITLRANLSVYRNPFGSDGNAIASLIFASNLSYPEFTYDDLAFPHFVPTHPLPTDGSVKASTVSIDVVVPALRAKLACRVYDSSKIRTNLTLDYTSDGGRYNNPLGINIEGEECNRFPKYEDWAYNNIIATRPNMTYFGLAQDVRNISEVQGCSDLLYTWGKLDYTADPIVQHIAALGCNETIETLSVSTAFVGANLTIDARRRPPQALENTTHPSSIGSDVSLVYAYLAQINAAPNSLMPFFAMLTSSPWAVPLSSLGDPAATDAIVEAIKRHHGMVQAQNFAQNLVPANTTNTTLPLDSPGNATDDQFVYDGTATTGEGEGPRRVVQDLASTRILQALLASALVLVVLGWAFMHETDVLPRSPTTIAGVVALLAGGNLFDEDFLGGGGVGWLLGGDHQHHQDGEAKGGMMDGLRFWMGWGTVTDWEGREVGGGENEGGVSRFGIFAVRDVGESQGDVGEIQEKEGEKALMDG